MSETERRWRDREGVSKGGKGRRGRERDRGRKE